MGGEWEEERREEEEVEVWMAGGIKEEVEEEGEGGVE